MRGMDRVDSQKHLPGWKSQSLGGTGLRCEGQGLKVMYEASFFTQRAVGAWNSLPGEGVEADTIVTVKGCLDKFHMGSMVGAGLEG